MPPNQKGKIPKARAERRASAMVKHPRRLEIELGFLGKMEWGTLEQRRQPERAGGSASDFASVQLSAQQSLQPRARISPVKASGGPNGNRTRVFGVRGRRPRPLDDGTLLGFGSSSSGFAGN